MSKPITIYLAGGCKNEPDEGKGWRREATEKIRTTAGWEEKRVEVIDPTEYFSYSGKRHKHDKQVMDYYYWRIRNSDVVLVNLNRSEDSCGTCMELQYASDKEIPIVGFGTEGVYNWTIPLAQVQFSTLTEAIDYLRDYYIASND